MSINLKIIMNPVVYCGTGCNNHCVTGSGDHIGFINEIFTGVNILWDRAEYFENSTVKDIFAMREYVGEPSWFV